LGDGPELLASLEAQLSHLKAEMAKCRAELSLLPPVPAAPAMTDGYPRLVALDAKRILVSFCADEVSIVRWVLLPAWKCEPSFHRSGVVQELPTAEQVRSGTAADGVPALAFGAVTTATAGDETHLVLTLARPLATSYTLFSTVEDAFGWDVPPDAIVNPALTTDAVGSTAPPLPTDQQLLAQGQVWRREAMGRIRGERAHAVPPAPAVGGAAGSVLYSANVEDSPGGKGASGGAVGYSELSGINAAVRDGGSLLERSRSTRASAVPSPSPATPAEELSHGRSHTPTSRNGRSQSTPGGLSPAGAGCSGRRGAPACVATLAAAESSPGALSAVRQATPDSLKMPDTLATKAVPARQIGCRGGVPAMARLLAAIDEGWLHSSLFELCGEEDGGTGGQACTCSGGGGGHGLPCGHGDDVNSAFAKPAVLATASRSEAGAHPEAAAVLSLGAADGNHATRADGGAGCAVRAHRLHPRLWRVLHESGGGLAPLPCTLAGAADEILRTPDGVGSDGGRPGTPSKGHVEGLLPRFLLEAFLSRAQREYEVLQMFFADTLSELRRSVEYLSTDSTADTAADHVAALGTVREFVLALVRAHAENSERDAASAKAEAERRRQHIRKTGRAGGKLDGPGGGQRVLQEACSAGCCGNSCGGGAADGHGESGASSKQAAAVASAAAASEQDIGRQMRLASGEEEGVRPAVRPRLASPDRLYNEAPDEYF